MPVLPSSLAYGRVTGRIILAVADANDVDSLPDAQAAQGTVTFAPKDVEIRLGPPEPVTVVKQPVVCTLDSEGYLVDPEGRRGVWLVTGVYSVSYNVGKASLTAHDILVAPAHTEEQPLDLSVAMPPGGTVVKASEYAILSSRIDSLVFEAAGVSSVNGATGAVVLDAGDVGALPSSYTPPAQSWADVAEKPATFAPTAHAASHATGGGDPIAPADIGAATAAQGAKADSAVQPDDVDDVIREGDARLTDARTPTGHSHAYADITDPPTIPGPQTLSLTGSDLALSGGGGTVTLPAGGGFSGSTRPVGIDVHLPLMDVTSPSLPGRPTSAYGGNSMILANEVCGTIIRLDQDADLWRMVYGVSTASTTPGALALAWVATWNHATREAVLVRDFGSVPIDAVHVEGSYTSYTGEPAPLPAGDYVLCFLPQTNVTLKHKNVYDAPGGYQGGPQVFNAGSNRVLAAPYADVSSFPATPPASITLGWGTRHLNAVSTAYLIPAFR